MSLDKHQQHAKFFEENINTISINRSELFDKASEYEPKGVEIVAVDVLKDLRGITKVEAYEELFEESEIIDDEVVSEASSIGIVKSKSFSSVARHEEQDIYVHGRRRGRSVDLIGISQKVAILDLVKNNVLRTIIRKGKLRINQKNDFKSIINRLNEIASEDIQNKKEYKLLLNKLGIILTSSQMNDVLDENVQIKFRDKLVNKTLAALIENNDLKIHGVKVGFVIKRRVDVDDVIDQLNQSIVDNSVSDARYRALLNSIGIRLSNENFNSVISKNHEMAESVRSTNVADAHASEKLSLIEFIRENPKKSMAVLAGAAATAALTGGAGLAVIGVAKIAGLALAAGATVAVVSAEDDGAISSEEDETVSRSRSHSMFDQQENTNVSLGKDESDDIADDEFSVEHSEPQDDELKMS